jgi:predicted ribosomally synthesized peptide with nif11-like leader
MSEEQFKAFLEAVKADAGLQEKLNAAADAVAAAAIANGEGFMISADELKQAQAKELTDEELEGVTGGTLPESSFLGPWFCLLEMSVEGKGGGSSFTGDN